MNTNNAGRETVINSQKTAALFPLGHLTATPGALALIEEYSKGAPYNEILRLVGSHITGNWPHDCEEDQQENREAIENGLRVFTSWITEGGKLWIITEADRSSTTILLPSEY